MTRTSRGVLALAFLSGGSFAYGQQPKPAEKPAATAATTKPPAAAATTKPAAATAKPVAPAAKAAPPAVTAAAATTTKAAATPAPTTAAAPELAKPSPELDTLYKGLEGSWKCDTTMAAGSMAPNSPELKVKSMVKIAKAKDLSGMWYRGEYEIKKTKAIPGFKGTFMLGYDALSKAALNVSYDNTGGAGLATGTNATGDSVTFVGESYVNGQKMKTRETMTKRGPKEVEHRFEADLGKGFQVMGTDECKK
jgi:hypothetical protein